MNTYLTEIRTIDGKVWAGPRIRAVSQDEAQASLIALGMGYAKVVGRLVTTINL